MPTYRMSLLKDPTFSQKTHGSLFDCSGAGGLYADCQKYKLKVWEKIRGNSPINSSNMYIKHLVY